MIYTCDKCFKTFTKKSNYIFHLKRKTPCKSKNINTNDLTYKNIIETNNNVDNVDNVDNMLTNVDNNFECIICHKIYKERTGLYKHNKKNHNNFDITNKNINESIHDTNESIFKTISTIINKQDLNNKQENETVTNVANLLSNVANPLSNVVNMLTEVKNEYKCLICHKIYKERTAFYRHKKNKHINYEEELQKIEINNKNNEENMLLKNKLEQTEKEINEIKQINEEYKNIIQTSKSKKSKNLEIIKQTNNTTNNTNNNTNNNITNNTLNNITVNNYIVDYGEEDLTKLTIDDKREILNSGSQIYPTLISKIYLNENIPQNNCICITNLRSDDMLIMENGVFVSVNKKKTMDDLLSNMSIFAKQTFGEIIKSKEEIEQDKKNINEKEQIANVNEKPEIVEIIKTNEMQKQIKKHKKPNIIVLRKMNNTRHLNYRLIFCSKLNIYFYLLKLIDKIFF